MSYMSDYGYKTVTVKVEQMDKAKRVYAKETDRVDIGNAEIVSKALELLIERGEK